MERRESCKAPLSVSDASDGVSSMGGGGRDIGEQRTGSKTFSARGTMNPDKVASFITRKESRIRLKNIDGQVVKAGKDDGVSVVFDPGVFYVWEEGCRSVKSLVLGKNGLFGSAASTATPGSLDCIIANCRFLQGRKGRGLSVGFRQEESHGPELSELIRKTISRERGTGDVIK